MDPLALASPTGATSMTSAVPRETDLPARPPQAAQPPYAFQPSSRGHQVLDEKHAHSPPLVQGTSFSSAGGTSVMTGHTIDTIDLEKGGLEAPSRQPESRRSSRAKERQESAERQHSVYTSRRVCGNRLPYDRESVRLSIDAEDERLDRRRLLESKSLRILLFLSAPCAALSFLLCIWSMLAILAIFIAAPIRLCTSPRSSLWEQILDTLTSSQRLQLGCIYASTANIQGQSVASLLANLSLSPFLSLGVAVAAWTVAIYWVLAAIVGDPDGSEGGNDGSATVLGLRKWWECWLLRPITAL